MRKISFLILLLIIIGYFYKQPRRIEVNLIGKTQAAIQKNKVLNQNKAEISKTESIDHKPLQQSFTTINKFTEKEIYCKLSKEASVTLSGDIKIQTVQFEDQIYAFIRSSQCADNKYSIIKINEDGKIENELDCQFASMEELVRRSGVTQWALELIEPMANVYNFALLGPGQFLVMCPGSGFQLTRRGHFVFQGGLLRDDQGCFLWHSGDSLNPNGGPITLKSAQEKINGSGCFEKSKQCIAQMDLQSPMIQKLTYKDAKNLIVDFEGNLSKASTSLVMSDTLEKLDTVFRGPTGISNWDYVESLQFPINCD